ncbi:MAG: hypothetical protein WD648_08965, partial [Planctomycetaceae bacterium]
MQGQGEMNGPGETRLRQSDSLPEPDQTVAKIAQNWPKDDARQGIEGSRPLRRLCRVSGFR